MRVSVYGSLMLLAYAAVPEKWSTTSRSLFYQRLLAGTATVAAFA